MYIFNFNFCLIMVEWGLSHLSIRILKKHTHGRLCTLFTSNTLATSCEELTHWERPWYWEGLGAGGEGDNRGWDGWMASPTWWTWVWVNSWSWWWTGRPGVLRLMGSQSWTRLSDWIELNWTEALSYICTLKALLPTSKMRFLFLGLETAAGVKVQATSSTLPGEVNGCRLWLIVC